jgi:phosphonate transport system ATP-binding protein
VYQYRLEDITKVFARHQAAVSGICLEVSSGERVALIGPSGAGKTTLFRMLNCSLKPSSGRLWINGDETSNLHGWKLRETRRKIGTIYQQHNLVPRLKVVHNVLCGQLGRWSLGRSIASLLKPADVDLAYAALKKVGIEDKIFSRTDELSGGQQQRVAIARVLVQDPDVILADEPVSSVDPSLASTIVRLLVDISQNTKKTLMVNLHSVDLALSNFPRIIGIKGGTALFDMAPHEVSDGLLQELYSGHLPETSEGGGPLGQLSAPSYG